MRPLQKLSFLVLVITSSIAQGTTVCSSYLDGAESILSPAVQDKWNKFSQGLEQKPTYARNDFFLWLLSGPYRRGVRQLLAQKTTAAEDQAICLEGAKKVVSQCQLQLDLGRLSLFYDQFCSGNSEAAKLLTAKVFYRVGHQDYPRRGLGSGPERDKDGKATRKWLLKMIAEKKFTPSEWLTLLTSNWKPIINRGDNGLATTTAWLGSPAAVLALADAVDGDFERIGLLPLEVEGVARQLLHENLPLRQIARWLDLSERQILGLQNSFTPLQWLENELRKKTISSNTPEQLAHRMAKTPLHDSYVRDDLFTEMLVDTTIPYPIVTSLIETFANHLPKGARLRVGEPNLNGLSEAQLDRAETYFGRAKIRPNKAWDESKAEAKSIEISLRGAVIHNVQDFMQTFTLKRYLDVASPATDEGMSELKLHATAEVFFRVLRDRLPEFLKLKPRAVEVRWLLETPLQFPIALHDDVLWRRSYMPFYRRWLTPKNRVIGRGEYMTAFYIFDILEKAMADYMPKAQTIEDWLEVMTFQVRGASEYESFQRWAMNKYAIHAMRIGKEKLAWIEEIQFSNAQALMTGRQSEDLRAFNLLAQMREMVPAQTRSDATLMAKAVEILLGSFPQDLASVRLFDDLNNPIRRMVLSMVTDGKPSAPEEVPENVKRQWVEPVRIELLEYLEA